MCNCRQIRSELARAVRQADVPAAAKAVQRGAAEIARQAMAKPRAVAAALARKGR